MNRIENNGKAVLWNDTQKIFVGLWGIPISCECIPPTSNVLIAVATFNIKTTFVDNIYNFIFVFAQMV